MQGVELNPKEEGNEKNNHSLEIIAKTVQEAIGQGLEQLNLVEDQVEIKIVREGSRGILGFGAEDAVVVLTPKQAQETANTQPEPIVESDQVESVGRPDSASDQTTVSSAPESVYADLDIAEEIQQRAQEILSTLLEKMDVQAGVTVRAGHDLVEADETIPLALDITGHDLGVLIGRRGETLQALQFIVRQILSKEVEQWVPIVVDVESYLVRRRKKLKDLAKRMADRAVFSKRKVILEPMSPQDRRIVHLHLKDHDAVYTQSVGDGERRKVVIFPK